LKSKALLLPALPIQRLTLIQQWANLQEISTPEKEPKFFVLVKMEDFNTIKG
jgi:hypothetical protein